MLAFNVLGVANDVRGGDSCGYFIDGKYNYGHEQTKLYENFFKTDEELKTITTAKIAIGHDRKASVGGVSLEKAQPVVITKEDDDNVVDFVLIHNGTINNHKELAKKYLKTNEKDDFSDSQIMAYIIYYHGFEVLQEYIGAGAFVMVDYRQDRENPTAYIFKGESMQSYSGKPQEERPLYLAMKQNEIWFSSLKSPLELITWNKNYKIIDLKTNTLFTIKDGTIIDEMEYDRTKIEWKSQYGSSVQIYRNGRYFNMDDYDEDDCVHYGAMYGKKNNTKHSPSAQYSGLHYGRSMGKPKTTSDPTIKREIHTNYIQDESSLYSYSYNVPDKIVYKSSENRYYLNNLPVDGKQRVTASGYISKDPDPNSTYVYEIYFFQGTIVKTKVAFDFLNELCTKLNINHRELYEHYEPLVWSMSLFPRFDYTLNVIQKHILEKDKDNNINIECKLYSGLLPVLFLQTDKIYTIDKGAVVSYIDVYTNRDFFDDYKAHVNDPYDYKDILEFFSTKLSETKDDTKQNKS